MNDALPLGNRGSTNMRHPNRHERRARAKRGRQQVFEMKLVYVTATPGDAHEALAVASVLGKVASDAPPFCMCCNAALSKHYPPTSVMLIRPFALTATKLMVGAICAGCDARGFSFVQAGVIAHFRDSGFMPDARAAAAGAA
jgi:hypothetical protein